MSSNSPAANSNNTVIEVRDLSKCYIIAHNRVEHSTLAETTLHRLKNPRQRPETEEFWSLRDVNFDVERGDVYGVVGRNGAGKSTLLKVLSQITEPTQGEVRLYGRIGSLLEVGTGFHAELTGRENIYLNGSILGMRRKEIARQFDDIVDFAGVEQFLDTPVKRYSSGMYVRLAFAVAAHLSSEILLIDEVLAVGDAEFQRKCLGKMRDVANSGRTVMFVSHHIQSVQNLCNKALFLDKGRLTYAGEVSGAIERYVASFEKTIGTFSDPGKREGTGEVRVVSASPLKEMFECGEEKAFRFTVEKKQVFDTKFYVVAQIVDSYGIAVLHCDSRMLEHWIETKDVYEGEFRFRTPWLRPGVYYLNLMICGLGGILDRYEQVCQMEVLPLFPYPAPANEEATNGGIVLADFSYSNYERHVAMPATLAMGDNSVLSDGNESDGNESNGGASGVTSNGDIQNGTSQNGVAGIAHQDTSH